MDELGVHETDRIVKINMEIEGYTLATVDSSRQTVAGSREEWTCRRACLVIAVSAVIGCLLSWTVLIPVFYTSRSSSSDPILNSSGSEQTVGSRVLPSPNESCVVAPEAGLYRVYSQITFAFDGRTHRSEVAHSVLVRTGDDEYMVQKKLISVPFRDPKLSKRHQTMDPSNLITSAKVATDDRICILVSPVGLVYKSQVDNVLMVVKEG
ncbi:hypothetical protein MAR_014074 [Mya arenaria]|uniref:Uncharacterized protein n=1 Tax=Mya arenaria TaxID=6604 RepID=A0ABY7G1R6_MYAAR|nr:hypothetical protein MAR_014074 [Mya arenaria]